MSTINQEKEKYWREKVAEAERREGGSLEAFCQAQGISLSTMGYWRKKFRNPQVKAVVPSKFVPVEIARPEPQRTLPDPRWLAEFIGQLVEGMR